MSCHTLTRLAPDFCRACVGVILVRNVHDVCSKQQELDSSKQLIALILNL